MASQTKPEYHGYKGKNTQTYKKLYGYKNLLVWQAADDLAAQIHTLTRHFGAGYYAHASQMLGSASSAKANIAEGYCRNTLGDYIRFCEIARGSLGELGSQLQDCERWGLIKNDELTDILKTFSNTTYFLEQLIKSLHEKRKAGTWIALWAWAKKKKPIKPTPFQWNLLSPKIFHPFSTKIPTNSHNSHKFPSFPPNEPPNLFSNHHRPPRRNRQSVAQHPPPIPRPVRRTLEPHPLSPL